MSLTERSKTGRSASLFNHGAKTMTETPESWKQKVAQMWWGVKVGERAENLRQAARRFDNVDSLTMATREKLMGKEVVDNNRPEGEDMHIGDDNSVIHQYLQPQQQQGGVMGSLAKMALGAGLLATGVGVPAGGYLIWDALKNRPTPAPVAPADPTVDTDTQYEIGLDP